MQNYGDGSWLGRVILDASHGLVANESADT
jgi:hypothetical protein